MAINYYEQENTFSLQTKNTTYQMKVDGVGLLLHTYYGAKTDDSDKSYLIVPMDRGFSGNPYALGTTDRTYSQDVLPQEYSGYGTGDYRESALCITNSDGSKAVELRYVEHKIEQGKYAIPGLPAVYVEDKTQADTLRITLMDQYTKVYVHLYYGVLSEKDVITRAAVIENRGTESLFVEKAASTHLDFQYGEYDFVTFYGKHAMEREYQRKEIAQGTSSVGSVRGASGHHHNPFVMICDRTATEEQGSCYGFSFVYSGEFLAEVSKDQIQQTRFVMGIHPENLKWKLEPGACFFTPEVMMAYSQAGMGAVSRLFHQAIRENICRGQWKNKQRPVLINNWEGTYFDFTGDKLAAIAADAAALGVELFVMDDGWFGKRDSDNSGLGDWYPNEKKLGCSLKELGDKITAQGMQFGIWFEPECICVDSDLYRAHPEWAVQIPGRAPQLSRNQLVLDFSRIEVQDYILEQLGKVLCSAPITYVKWDFNRSICDKFSQALPPQQQGEMAHRFVLGLYRVLEQLLTQFPHILFEGCSGGGGRFDAGMLYYTPQIWCSDNTDAIERLKIQYGTSFGYPVVTMGAHVSACPNHQTGRITPLGTRSIVAMSGTFGYELDVNQMTQEEKEEVRQQIGTFKKYYKLLQYGNYHRLTSPYTNDCVVWEMAAEDRTEALVNVVYQNTRPNPAPIWIKIKGLEDAASYQLILESGGNSSAIPDDWKEKKIITGSALMSGGLALPRAMTQYQVWMIHIKKC